MAKNSDGIQIIGDKIYYQSEHVATVNELSKSTILNKFKRRLVNMDAQVSTYDDNRYENQGHNID